MNANEALVILRIALDLAERMAAIAKSDPAVWEQVKQDYNKSMEAFKNAGA